MIDDTSLSKQIKISKEICRLWSWVSRIETYECFPGEEPVSLDTCGILKIMELGIGKSKLMYMDTMRTNYYFSKER